MKYRLEKLVDGEWWEEGTYSEGKSIEHLASAIWFLAKINAVDDMRVIVIDE